MQNLIFCQIFSVLLHLLSFRFPFSFFLPFRPFFPSRPFSFFPRLSELPRILFFLPPLFSFPLFSSLSPPASFSYFCLSDTPLLFSPFSFNPFLHLVSECFFSPCAFPPEHNISEHKPKHTDASFCRPKCRTRQIIKNLPVTTGMYKNIQPDRPKFRTSKHPQNKFCLHPGKYAKQQKIKPSRPGQKHYPFQTANTATNAPKADSRTEKSVSACLHGHLNYLP